MKNKIKFSILLIIIMVIGNTTACQKTPEKQLVKSKTENTFMDIINNDNDNNPDIEVTGASFELVNKFDGYISLWCESVEVKQKNIYININANVITPITDKLPIYEIYLNKFSQEQVDDFLSIFGDAEYRSGIQIKTKEFYENEIIRMRKYLEVELPKKDVDEETRQRLKEEYEAGIENYTKKYEEAPETIDEIIDPTFTNQYIIQYSEQESSSNNVEETPSEEENKSAKEYYEEQNTEVIDVNWDYNGDNLYLNVGRSDNTIYNGFSFYRVSNDESKNELYPIIQSSSDIDGLSMSYEEAKVIAEDTIIQKLGIDYFTIAHSAREENSCYVFFFTRNINGVNATYCSNTQKFYERYDKPWNEEKLYFMIDEKGIKKIWMQSSLSLLGEEISDDIEILPFSEIKDIALEQFAIGNIDFKSTIMEGGVGESLKEMNMNIDEIVLGYMRVKLSDNSGKYVMVPVWDFFGNFEASGEYDGGYEYECKSEDMDYVNSYRHSYLTINAIDGSIIDRSLGY